MTRMLPPGPTVDPVLPVQAFVQAAACGRRVWVQRGERGLEVRSGRGRPAAAKAPPGTAKADTATATDPADEVPSASTLALFALALRARYGAQAASVALRELHRGHGHAAGALDAQAVHAAVERAESLQALQEAQAQLWRLEFSAVLLGRRFVALCERCGIDAHRLPPSRRQAIDAAMGWPTPASPQADEQPDALAERLRALLLQALH